MDGGDCRSLALCMARLCVHMLKCISAHSLTCRAMPCHAVMRLGGEGHPFARCPSPPSRQAGGLPSPDCCTALSPWAQARCHCDE